MSGQSFEELESLLKNASEPYFERRDALSEIARDYPDGALPLLEWSLGTDEKAVRRKAAELLEKFPGLKSVKVLLSALHDEDDDVLKHALKSIGEVGDESVIPHIEKLQEHKSYFVKREAEKAIKALKERLGNMMGGEKPPAPPEKTETKETKKPDDLLESAKVSGMPEKSDAKKLAEELARKNREMQEKISSRRDELHARRFTGETPVKEKPEPEKKPAYAPRSRSYSRREENPDPPKPTTEKPEPPEPPRASTALKTETPPSPPPGEPEEKKVKTRGYVKPASSFMETPAPEVLEKKEEKGPGKTALKCASCGKEYNEGDHVCLFCGSLLREKEQKPAPPPKTGEMEELKPLEMGDDLAFFLRSDSPVFLGSVIDNVSENRMDHLAREIERGGGVLVSKANSEESALLLELFRKNRVPYVKMPASEILKLPPAKIIRNASLYRETLKLTLRNEGDSVEREWKNLFLCVCGVIEQTSKVPSERLFESEKYYSSTPRIMIDILFSKPSERFRIQKDVPEFGRDRGKEDHFRKLGQEFYRLAADEAMNPGVRILSRNGFRGNWNRVTFRNLAEFDDYCHWLMQVRKYELNLINTSRSNYFVPRLGKVDVVTGKRRHKTEKRDIVTSTYRRGGASRRYSKHEGDLLEAVAGLVGDDKDKKTIFIVALVIIWFLIFIIIMAAVSS